jgi:hypothetical protein
VNAHSVTDMKGNVVVANLIGHGEYFSRDL